MRPLLLIVLAALLLGSQAIIHHLTDKNFNSKVNEAPFTLVYFYSSSCKFCKEFTPLFEKLSKNKQLLTLNISFAKMDAPTFKDLAQGYEAYSYPTIAVFFKGISQPVIYRKARTEKDLLEFLPLIVKPFEHPSLLEQINQLTPEEIVAGKFAIFKGKRDSYEYQAWDVVAKRDNYIRWAFVESEQPSVVIGTHEITQFQDLKALEGQLEAIYARLHRITEESWLKMADRKKFTIVYINKFGNKKTRQLLEKIAKDVPNVHFLEIDTEEEDYKEAVRYLGMNDEENIISVDKLYDATYIAASPYTEAGLKEFIEKAKVHKLELYRKSESSDKPNKLTRNNYEERMSTSQDVVLFLYDRKEQISKELMSLFEFLLVKLKDNKNLLLLRCDIKLNEVEEKLGFLVNNTPRIVYYRNRMKDYPIHFSGKTISARTVIEFIMENTTFDFEDGWAEL